MNNSNKLPYVIVGSAVGGAIGYLFMTQSGTKLRQSIMENGTRALPEKIEGAREFLERKGKVITDKVHGVLDRAKESMQAGQQAYQEAEQNYQSQLRTIQGRNTDIASNVHKTVDELSHTASAVEKSFLDPVYEFVALARGVDRGVRRFFKRPARVVGFGGTGTEGAAPFYKDERLTGY